MSIENARGRLDSWKSIATHFGRGERTVRRWEAELGLPVRRMPGSAKGRVFAMVDELEAWRTGVSPAALEAVPGSEELLDVSPSARSAPPASAALDRRPRALVGVAIALTAAAVAGWWAVRSAAKPANAAPPFAAEKLYVEGTDAWTQRTPVSLSTALDDFNAAIRLDPDYAQAWLGLAKTYNLMREYTFMPEAQAYPLARNAARKALSLDDRLAEGHAALAFVDYWGFWKAEDAAREYRRAIVLDPSSATAHHWYATFLLNRRESAAAVAEIDRAAALDPSSEAIQADRGYILFNAGMKAEGLAMLSALDSRDPGFPSTHLYLSRLDLELGRDPDFLREASLAARTTNEAPGVEAARRGFETGGRAGMLRAMLADSLARFQSGSGSAIDVADAYARAGQPGAALQWLAKSVERREPGFVTVEGNRDYDAIRDTPTFRALSARIG